MWGLLTTALTAVLGSFWNRLFPVKTAAAQKATALSASLTIANAELKAATDAPTDKQSLINTLKSGKICVLGALFLSLTSCASPVALACPQPRQWSPAQQDEIAANLAVLPPDSPLIAMGIEWATLRAKSKACNGG